MLTNAKLERLYRYYNRKYFGGKLPVVKVKFTDLIDKYGAVGNTHYEARVPEMILIDKTLRRWNITARLTLLHEMVHVKLPYKIVHGKMFEKEMRRLARLGAFTGLW
jgi:hypothetical protein